MMEIGDLDTLHIHKGDIIAIRPKAHLSENDRAHLKVLLDAASNKFGVDFILVDHDMGMAVIRKDDH